MISALTGGHGRTHNEHRVRLVPEPTGGRMRIDYAVWKILANPAAVSAILAQLSAQLFKVLRPIASGKRPQVSRLSEYGGFPSGHTAFITGVTAAAGFTQGFDSGLFAVAAVTAAILIYDILKQRRAVDLTMQATRLLLDKNGLQWPHEPPQFKAHSPAEVLGGAIWGILVALVVCLLWPALPT